MLTVHQVASMLNAGEMEDIEEQQFRGILSRVEAVTMIDAALESLRCRPSYEATLVKIERVGGRMPAAPDVIRFRYTRRPVAIDAQWIGGPNLGRSVQYDAARDPKSVTAREAGWMGMVPVSLSLDSSLLKRDTTHTITEMGLEYALTKARSDLLATQAAGTKVDPRVGRWFERNGRAYWEVNQPLPTGGRARSVFEVASGLLVEAELWDSRGELSEMLTYRDVKWLAPSTCRASVTR